MLNLSTICRKDENISRTRFLDRITRSSNVKRGCCLVGDRRAIMLSLQTARLSRPVGGGAEVTFKPLVAKLSVRESPLVLTSPGKMRLFILL
ncbi:hypothetical protein J6590_080730 [Homalodisca vitripennis]|nr:hypothetical protein J6590_080730 [Homalodisca vitripennis]